MTDHNLIAETSRRWTVAAETAESPRARRAAIAAYVRWCHAHEHELAPNGCDWFAYDWTTPAEERAELEGEQRALP